MAASVWLDLAEKVSEIVAAPRAFQLDYIRSLICEVLGNGRRDEEGCRLDDSHALQKSRHNTYFLGCRLARSGSAVSVYAHGLVAQSEHPILPLAHQVRLIRQDILPVPDWQA